MKIFKKLNKISRKTLALAIMISIISYNFMPSVIASISTKNTTLNSISDNTYNVTFDEDGTVNNGVASYLV